MTPRTEMEAVFEAILFVTSQPVSREKFLSVFSDEEQEEAERALEAVLERYRSPSGQGVKVDEAGGGVRLVTRPEYHSYLRRFFEVTGRNKLSMAALETLAIIAYRQPVTLPEIQELRSVNSQGVLKTLLERRLIRIAGRKEVVGRPFLYSTSREFLLHFGLKELDDLPPLEEFEEVLAGEADLVGELGGEEDREEDILRQAAEIEEREAEVEDGAGADQSPAEEAEAVGSQISTGGDEEKG